MSVKIFDDYQELSREVGKEIIEQVRRKPESVLCLAAGDTPRRAYNLLALQAREEKVDFRKCTFVGLDEWLGIPPENEGSCAFFLRTNIFSPMQIPASNIRLFNALSADPESECRNIDEHIHRNGGIDLMVVGVGMNGHIGFNEPGVSDDLYAHVIDLDQTTQSVGQKYFKETTALRKGITLGFKHVMESRRVIMMASGTKKAAIIQKALGGPVSTHVPASLIRRHNDAIVMLDKDAASGLTIGHEGNR